MDPKRPFHHQKLNCNKTARSLTAGERSNCPGGRAIMAARASGSKMLQLYGNPRSRAMRCLWMLEEIGRPYQLIEKSTRADDLQTADYLRLNPNARIPTLIDGDVVIWELMAINI